ncbi:MAG: GAF domain-containing protein [Euryarchaeota archaeon]|nr:GAF domain-containing protein [Euryarchaeota archaeon]
MEKNHNLTPEIISEDLKKLNIRVSQMIGDSSLKKISDLVLEEATRLTGSDYCYVAVVDPENQDSVGVSFSHLTAGCQYYADLGEARFKIRKDGTYGGLLGYSLDTGESFFTHDPVNHPVAHGIPPGHETINQFLSVAVKHHDKILGQIVLANPEKDYSELELEITDEIASIYALALDKLL